jgi:hypothetical protein
MKGKFRLEVWLKRQSACFAKSKALSSTSDPPKKKGKRNLIKI